MQERWIKLFAKLLDNPVFDNPAVLKVWIWALLKATYQEQQAVIGYQTISLAPGQFVYGRFTAADKLKMTESTVRNNLATLVKLGLLDIKSTNKFSVVTIKNWSVYQEVGQQSKNKVKTKRQQSTTYKKDKNDKNITYVQPEVAGIQKMFALFYQINPTIKFGNKTQRAAAQNIIQKLGEEKALRTAEAAVAIFGKQYAPTITNPLQLESKLSELVSYYKKQTSQSLVITDPTV